MKKYEMVRYLERKYGRMWTNATGQTLNLQHANYGTIRGLFRNIIEVGYDPCWTPIG